MDHLRPNSSDSSHLALRYRPEVDGLRAVAIGAVIMNHAGFGVPGGYVGVDVFFVISGYLITSLIVSRFEKGTFSFQDFWERRVRRIAPAFLAMQACVLAAGWWLFLPRDFGRLSLASAAQSVFLGNVYSWRDTGYFSVNAALRPFLHTWSLAVEEQFYLIFPCVVVLALHRKPKWLWWLLSAGCITSLLASIIGTYRSPSATYYLLPTRAWEMLTGSLLALSPQAIAFQKHGGAVAWSGLLLITAAATIFSDATPFPGWAATLPAAGAALVLLGGAATTSTATRLLGSPLMVAVGKLSYPLYLWHWPLLAFARYCKDGPLDWRIRAGLVAAAFACAWISVLFVESPIRDRRWLASRRSIFVFCGSIALSILLASGLIFKGDGFSSRLPLGLRQPSPNLSELVVTVEEAADGRFPTIGNDGPSKPPAFLVWGDSQSVANACVFDDLGAEHGVSGLLAGFAGAIPLPGVCVPHDATLQDRNQHVANEIAKRQIKHVFLIARWAWYVEGQAPYDIFARGGNDRPLIHEAGDSRNTKQAAASLFRVRLHALCRTLADQGCSTYLVMQTPDQPADPYRRAFLRARGAGLLTSNAEATVQDYRNRTSLIRQVFDEVASDVPRVQVIDCVHALVAEDGVIECERDGEALYFDDHHFTPVGANVALRDVLEPIFAEIRKTAAESHEAVP